jgi:hypothetical protein
MQLGSIRVPNALGDYISTEFANETEILINKYAKVIKRDIETSNGFIHIIDHVLDPFTESVYELVLNNPSYSIFAKGLEKTGLSDTLTITSIPFGQKQARTRFTLLAIPDTMFNRFGINSVEDLINKYTPYPDSITFLENGFYRYMEYHCLAGSNFMSDITTKLYPILSTDNNVLMRVDRQDYKINYNPIDSSYTGFILASSNMPAKNGVVHTITGLLPVITPPPTSITFETTDFFDLQQGEYYGKHYMKWSDGQNTFEKIKWEGEYLQYYYKRGNIGANILTKYDCLNMTGWGWIEITTPKIMKGTYRVSANIWTAHADYNCYVDGQLTGFSSIADVAYPEFGTFTWTKTEEHKIKIVLLNYGQIFWDSIFFYAL